MQNSCKGIKNCWKTVGINDAKTLEKRNWKRVGKVLEDIGRHRRALKNCWKTVGKTLARIKNCWKTVGKNIAKRVGKCCKVIIKRWRSLRNHCQRLALNH